MMVRMTIRFAAPVFVLLVLAACDPMGGIAPPAWIQGNWVYTYSGSEVVVVEWIFEENDVKVRQQNVTYSLKGGYQGASQWTQSVTDDTYELIGKIAGSGVTVTYVFRRTATGIDVVVSGRTAYSLRRK